ncbi:MAG TPA: class I lanthipeptide [Holophagaceae bacterium]|nr:class I lanthipeptide [Holophagaceae bacterium]
MKNAKLSLNKETLRVLDARQSEEAAGGMKAPSARVSYRATCQPGWDDCTDNICGPTAYGC